jgi:hypothetical protein
MEIPKENLIPEFKMSNMAIPFVIMLIVLISIIFILLFNQGFSFSFSNSNSNSNTNSNTNIKMKNEITKDVFIVTTFILVGISILFFILPNFKENIRKFLEQIWNTFIVFIYTIFFIVFFLAAPTDILNKYGYIITPLTMLLTIFLFYKGFSKNYIENFNITYERIKTVILFLCLITIIIVYYSVDPGGYINKYYGSSLILTILLAVFSLLYLIILLTLPDTINPINITSGSSNFFDNFSKFSVYGGILFILFIILVTIGIYKYPGGINSENNRQTFITIIILLLLVLIVWGSGLLVSVFPEVSDKSMNISNISTFKKSLLVLFGITISGLLIAWIVYYLHNLSGETGITSFMLNLLLVLVFLVIIYKAINVELPGNNSRKNGFFSLIINLILYIPCLLSGLFDSIVKMANGENAESFSSIGVLLFAMILFIIYYKIPSLVALITLQGGQLLVNNPVDTNKLYTLASYEELNGTDKFEYQYGLSFWVFLDVNSPSSNSSSNKFVSLLNYGDKPNILYKASTNTIMITMEQKGLTKLKNKLIDFDENGNRILYKQDNVLLQKWNNIVINYTGGTLDIFFNNELVKSEIEVVPYMTLDSLTIGSDDGINGGICNVVYFKSPLTTSKMYILYNMVKDKTPPITSEANKSIIKIEN